MVIASSAITNCAHMGDAIAQDRCRLNESSQLDPPPDCEKRTTQFDLNVCSFRDYLKADIELNRAWQAVSKRMKSVDGKKSTRAGSFSTTLLAGQRAWLTYRDKQCDLWAKWYEGGTIASLAVNICLIDITKFRTTELGQLLKDN